MPNTAAVRTLDPASLPIVGVSERTRQTLKNIERVAQGRFPVLVLGETGTGKGLAAKTIYNVAPEGPFVVIDCSSIVPTLMESELFGHTKGAFTGAVGAKLGMVELANGGTAFFDEIGELPLDVQAKLLRVLEDKQFRPVGSATTRSSDFRIIAATNRDLEVEVRRGTFRADLFYRLNVVTIRLAPLRDRTEDIPVLASHFLARYSGRYEFTEEAMQALREYDWPGNVRQLENCIHQMVAVNSGPLLHVAQLPSPIQHHLHQRDTFALSAAVSAAGLAAPPAAASAPQCPVIPLVELERRAIAEALRYTKGDRNLAAMLLGIGRTTLYRKIKDFKIGSLESSSGD